MRTFTRLLRAILTALALGGSMASWGCADTTAPDPLAGCTLAAIVRDVDTSGNLLDSYKEYRCADHTLRVYTDGHTEVWH